MISSSLAFNVGVDTKLGEMAVEITSTDLNQMMPRG